MKSEDQSINARLWRGEFRTACYETAAICGTLVPTSMAVTGYLGLPAEMANILLRPPTRSVTRSLGSLLFGVPRTHMIALPHDTYSLRVIIVIYAPTTNVTSLICPSRLILRSCLTWKLTLFRCTLRRDLTYVQFRVAKDFGLALGQCSLLRIFIAYWSLAYWLVSYDLFINCTNKKCNIA